MTMPIADPQWLHEAVHGNYAERAPLYPLPTLRVWAYTDHVSYIPGQVINISVNTNADHYSLTIIRDGREPKDMYHQQALEGIWRTTPEDCSVIGCGWPISHSLEIPIDWPSGGYIIRTQVSESDGPSDTHDHTVIIGPKIDTPKQDRLLLIAATATWHAYNDWGGSNHYQGYCGPDKNAFAPVVSLQRPFAKGFVVLPEDAPRAVLTTPPAINSAPRYPHMEWAYANGYSKKYVSAGWASFERHFIIFAENENIEIDIISQTDLHERPEILNQYRCVTMVGHDEYWSWKMRDAIDNYVRSGGHVARFAGNFMWQIRLENDGTTQVCYKYTASTDDPYMVSGPRHLVTESWEASELDRPGAASFGLNATMGLYASWSGCSPRGAKGFPIYRPEHWAFTHTGLYYGDVLGADSFIFGYEVDGLCYTMRDGLPFPEVLQPHHYDMEILALGLSSTLEEGQTIMSNHTFLGTEDAEYVARVLHGETTPATIAKTKLGCGLIVNFKSGKGEVFHAGSTDWVAGLMRRDPMVIQVTKNVLQKFLKRP